MKWTKEEIKYLKENYASKKITFDDLKKKLKRSKRAISHKGSRLGLSRPRIPVNKPKDPNYRKIIDKKYYEKNKKEIYRKRRFRFKMKKKEIVDFLGGKCSNCGYNKCGAALELHHKTSDKNKNVAQLIESFSKEKVLKEIKKCILLCANCHRELHHLV